MGCIVWKIVIGDANACCTGCGKSAGLAGIMRVVRSTEPTVRVGETLCGVCQNQRCQAAEQAAEQAATRATITLAA